MNNQDIAYVRTEMLPQKAPPSNQVGPVKWLRENLLSSPFNIVLTLLSLYVIYQVLHHLVPWFSHMVWNAENLQECRAVRDATWGPDATMSCFAVIRDRWHQLLFGFYPQDAYWRPVLALAIFLIGLLPVLFANMPRWLFAVTLASPLVAAWLIWGGPIWTPLLVAAGFVVGWYVFAALANRMLPALATTLGILAMFVFWRVALGGLFGLPSLSSMLSDVAPIGLPAVQSDQLGGFMLALIIGLSGIVLSLPLGIMLALGRQSDLFFINKCSVIFIEVIRGVPLIVWLITASLLLQYFLPPQAQFDVVVRVIIMVTLFASAYIAEVVRGGLAALPKGQYEAADALGLDYAKAMRLIVLPQALKISIPGIVNTFIGMFKDTTLVMLIGLLDILGWSDTIRQTSDWNGVYWELYVFVGLLFFIFCFSMGRYSLWLEKKLQRGHR